MRLNKKIIIRIAVLSLPAVIPVFFVMIALLTMWTAGLNWTPDAAGSVAALSIVLGVVLGTILAVGLLF